MTDEELDMCVKTARFTDEELDAELKKSIEDATPEQLLAAFIATL